MSEPGLGLRLQPHRVNTDAQFLLRTAPDSPLDRYVRMANVTHVLFRPPLDQGSEGTCVGHAGQIFLESAPVIQLPRRPQGQPNAYALDFYDRAWCIDGNGPGPVDRSTGLTLDSLFRIFRQDGYVTEWRHTFEPDEVIRWVGGVDSLGKPIGGPLVLGIPWFQSMDGAGPDGFVRVIPSSGLRGYHAICVRRWDQRQGGLWFVNSWGRRFGRLGHGFLPGEGLVAAFQHFGHGVTALEKRIV